MTTHDKMQPSQPTPDATPTADRQLTDARWVELSPDAYTVICKAVGDALTAGEIELEVLASAVRDPDASTVYQETRLWLGTLRYVNALLRSNDVLAVGVLVNNAVRL